MRALSKLKIENANQSKEGGPARILSDPEGATLDVKRLSRAIDALLAEVPAIADLPAFALRNVRAAIAVAYQIETMVTEAAELISDADLLLRQMTTKRAEQDIVASRPFRCSYDDMVGFVDVLLEQVEALQVLHMVLDGERPLEMYGSAPTAYQLGIEVSPIFRLRADMHKCFDPAPGRPPRRNERAAVAGVA
ncbi:hypothetical protein [Rhizobium sp. LjRoot254]|uniref:hypothetical protein n=1 Tax=Rhizobium sp. LjRoot254 TaxID=3342297 RepID=UPI003ECED8AB